jgi:hypothetical protein
MHCLLLALHMVLETSPFHFHKQCKNQLSL